MGKSKKVQAPAVEPTVPVNEGDIDPYSAGKKIANPEPDNNAANRPVATTPAQDNSGQALPPAAPNMSNSDVEEQDEVAAGRQETPAEEEVETPAEEPTPEAPVADPPVGEGETFEPSTPTTPTPGEIAAA